MPPSLCLGLQATALEMSPTLVAIGYHYGGPCRKKVKNRARTTLFR